MQATPMTRALPMKLPDDFSWVLAQSTDDWVGARLELHGCAVIQVSPCRSGWLVQILLTDPLNPQANVAVRSVAAGMRWSARWARERVSRLRVLVEEQPCPAVTRDVAPPRSAVTPLLHQPSVL